MFTIEQTTHFWTHVDIQGPEDCWPWQGQIHNSGCCVVELAVPTPEGLISKGFLAHRIAFHLVSGRRHLHAGVINHICNDWTCCNPNHLILMPGPG